MVWMQRWYVLDIFVGDPLNAGGHAEEEHSREDTSREASPAFLLFDMIQGMP